MAKKDKEIKRLRREVEILRAQLKGVGGSPPGVPRSPASPAGRLGEVGADEKINETPEPSPPSLPSLSYVRSDLRRSLIITAILIAAIGGLVFSQPHWPKVASLAAKVIPF